MKALVIFDSEFGNTERMAQAIAYTLGDFGDVKSLRVQNVRPPDLDGVDLVVVGGPTQRHGLSQRMRDFLVSMPDATWLGKGAATFDTRRSMHWLITGSAARGIAKKLRQKGCVLLLPPESFLVMAHEGPTVDGEMTHAAAWAKKLGQTFQHKP